MRRRTEFYARVKIRACWKRVVYFEGEKNAILLLLPPLLAPILLAPAFRLLLRFPRTEFESKNNLIESYDSMIRLNQGYDAVL